MSLDAPPILHPIEGVTPSPSGSHPTHSRQMSSLSMNTFATAQSYYPSEPLLPNADHPEAHARQPPHPDTSAEDRRYWEMASARRMRRLRLFKGILMSIIGSWASYTTIRYIIAYVVYSDRTRRMVALSLGISSLLSLLVAGVLALSLVIPRYTNHSRPISRSLGKSLRHVSQILVSFFLFVPATVNLALIFAWRSARSEFSLRGRCHWNLDVVWVGVGGQCGAHHAPAWGVWLAAAISRFVLTVAILIMYHLASRSYRVARWLHYCAEDGQRRDNLVGRMAQGDALSRPSPVLQPYIQKSGGFPSVPQPSFSNGRMAVIPEFNEARNQVPLRSEHEYAELDSFDSSTLSEDDSLPRSTEASEKTLRRTKSSRDVYAAGDASSRHDALASNVGEGDLDGFADRFRAIVDRVSRELEDARNLENEHEPPPRTPPLHHVLDTHTPYMSIDEFGREVHTEEPIPMFGGVIRRMPTIDSVGSRELASLHSTTLISACGGGAGASSSASSRPPTRGTMVSFNDAASVSLASASAASSRSNSIHRPRMPSELGELVRDALRARGQPRPGSASTRPGSGGSGGSCGAENGCAPAPPRSRSNSQCANEVLAPVTEHGEHEDAPRAWAPRRLCDTPEMLLAAGASEMGELAPVRPPRVQRSRSLGSSSSPSRSGTSTTYFTAGTGSSGETGQSGGGGAPR